MTDPTDPELDELVSAHLDGETTPDEDARLGADPAARARLERWREVQAAVRTPTPIDAERRETAITAALAAFAADDEPATATPGTVTPLAPRRSPSGRATQVLRIAAVVLVAALLIPVAWSLGGGSSDDEASFDSTGAAIEGGADTGDQADEEAAPEALDSGVTADAGGDAVVALGSFDDLEALAAAIAAPAAFETLTERSPRTTTDAYVRRLADCRPELQGIRAVAVVGGAPVLVVIRTIDAGQLLTVIAREDCRVLDERRL